MNNEPLKALAISMRDWSRKRLAKIPLEVEIPQRKEIVKTDEAARLALQSVERLAVGALRLMDQDIIDCEICGIPHVAVSPRMGGCWFCHCDMGELCQDGEFDTAYHESCLLEELKDANNGEARLINAARSKPLPVAATRG